MYFPESEGILKRFLHGMTDGMTDKSFLEAEIKKWLVSDERARQTEGKNYYDGNHDILKRKRTVIGEDGRLTTVENLPNNRIVNNQYKKIVEQKANYLCGKPISFDTDTPEYGAALTRFFDRRRQRILRIIAEYALNGGKAWVCPYYDNGDLLFAVFPAYEVLPFWADEAHTQLDCAVHFFSVYEYDEYGTERLVNKVEVFHGGGIDRFIWDNGYLVTDPDALSGPYISVTDRSGARKDYNWDRIPLICFKVNHCETPLICSVKCLQDALNLVESNLVNAMEQDVGNTIIVLKNYDGENLGEFRRNLAAYGAVKVRTVDGAEGGVEALTVDVSVDNYKSVIELLKKAIIENAKGYDAKDDRLSGNPNQMNIQSMYSDIDLDANCMETEFQAAFEELLFFVNSYFANAGIGNFENEKVNVIFNRDILINEGEAIENCGESRGLISDETIIKMHPWVDDPIAEIARISAEKESATALTDSYGGMFANADTGGTGDEKQ